MRRLATSLPLLLGLLMPPAYALAQSQASGRAGKRSLLATDVEIALARSAAPREVSAAADVYTLTDTGYVLAVRGTNGNACLVNRSWPDALEPHCFDAEASATVMQHDLLRTALYQRGISKTEVDRDIADRVLDGRLKLPRRPAMTYMMSAAQVLYDDSGKKVGAWQPHLMLHMPYLTSEELGLGSTPNPAAAIMVDSGKPNANLMIIVTKAIAPEPAAAR